MAAERGHVLPDLLRPGLKLVFCGTAAGLRSARERAYYAHPGNAFWRTLHETGLTPRRLAPHEFPLLPTLGIGLTDLAKHHAGNDAQLPPGAFDATALQARILDARPRALAFTSKRAGSEALGRPVDYGWQPERIGATRLYVLPSPSGQARAAWRIEPWQELADWVRSATDDLSCTGP